MEDHDQEVAFGIGFGLAALVAAGMALAWGRFRASGAVTTLGGIERGKALALCLSGGFLLVAVGAALSGGGGFVGAVGALFLGLGIALPAGLLLARHSTEIERGRAKPILGRERFPSWALRSAAALLLVISLTSLGAGLFAERPAGMEVSPQLREDATALTSDAGRRQLRQAATEEKAARTRAAGPLARQRATRVALRQATRRLRAAGRRLASAEADESRFARRVAVQVKREEREAAEAEERAQQEAEEQAEEAEEEPSGCDPNYSPCVPSYPPDVDCAEVGGPVSVTGSDPHGLDADNDGVGCE